MIRILITKAACEAAATTLLKGRAYAKHQRLNSPPDGMVAIFLPRATARALADLRRPGESYSDAIIRVTTDTPIGATK